MGPKQQLEEIEISETQAKNIIDRGVCMERLLQNQDFQKVFLEGYMKDEASRVVLMKADPNMQDEIQQIDLDKQITAIGYFKQYINNMHLITNMAKRDLEEFELTREELIKEIN